jgi:hypothetical protein
MKPGRYYVNVKPTDLIVRILDTDAGLLGCELAAVSAMTFEDGLKIQKSLVCFKTVSLRDKHDNVEVVLPALKRLYCCSIRDRALNKDVVGLNSVGLTEVILKGLEGARNTGLLFVT